MSDLTEFLSARIAEDEAVARAADEELAGHALVENGGTITDDAGLGIAGYAGELLATHLVAWQPARVLAECEAKRRIVALHQDWPVLIEKPLTVEMHAENIEGAVFRASQEIAWLTTREYVARFGSDPPAAPILRALASVYADHEQFREEWR